MVMSTIQSIVIQLYYFCCVSETNLTSFINFCRGPVVFAGAVLDTSRWHQGIPGHHTDGRSSVWTSKSDRDRSRSSHGVTRDSPSCLLDLKAKRSEVDRFEISRIWVCSFAPLHSSSP